MHDVTPYPWFLDLDQAITIGMIPDLAPFFLFFSANITRHWCHSTKR